MPFSKIKDQLPITYSEGKFVDNTLQLFDVYWTTAWQCFRPGEFHKLVALSFTEFTITAYDDGGNIVKKTEFVISTPPCKPGDLYFI